MSAKLLGDPVDLNELATDLRTILSERFGDLRSSEFSSIEAAIKALDRLDAQDNIFDELVVGGE